MFCKDVETRGLCGIGERCGYLVGLVVLEDGTDGACAGAERRVEHVHVLLLLCHHVTYTQEGMVSVSFIYTQRGHTSCSPERFAINRELSLFAPPSAQAFARRCGKAAVNARPFARPLFHRSRYTHLSCDLDAASDLHGAALVVRAVRARHLQDRQNDKTPTERKKQSESTLEMQQRSNSRFWSTPRRS